MEEFSFHENAEAIATALLGQPNKTLSTQAEWRYGNHGSLAVDLRNARYYDHEAEAGGGILDLINREIGGDRKAAWEWLEANGFKDRNRPNTRPQPEVVYTYHNESGAPIFQVVRLPGKQFRQRKNERNWSMKGVGRELYRLPDVLRAKETGQPIYFCEGEKDAEALVALGLCATCNPGGAISSPTSNKWRPHYSEALAGADLIILEDNDEPGRIHAEAVAKAISSHASRIRIVGFEDLPPKSDVSDFLKQFGVDELKQRITSAKIWGPKQDTEQPAYEEWRSGWGYVAAINKFVHLETNTWHCADGFKTLNAHRLHEGQPYTKLFLTDPDSQRALKIDMQPGVPAFHGEVFNAWQNSPVLESGLIGNPASRAVQLFTELVDHLARGRSEICDVLLHWAGWGFWNQSQRLRWAPYIISVHKGQGKGLFTATIGKLYGSAMSSHCGQIGSISGRFSGGFAGKMFVSVAETVEAGSSKYGAVEALKPLISEDALLMEFKGRDAFMLKNFTRYVFCSSHLDGLKIDEDERRFFIINMKSQKPKSQEWYAAYAQVIEDKQSLADIAAFLKQWKDTLLPTRAPQGDMTDLQEAFRPIWLTDLEDEFQGRAVAISSEVLLEYARRESGQCNLSAKAVGKALQDAGWYTGRRRFAGERVRYWSTVEGHDNLTNLTNPARTGGMS